MKSILLSQPMVIKPFALGRRAVRRRRRQPEPSGDLSDNCKLRSIGPRSSSPPRAADCLSPLARTIRRWRRTAVPASCFSRNDIRPYSLSVSCLPVRSGRSNGLYLRSVLFWRFVRGRREITIEIRPQSLLIRKNYPIFVSE